MGKVLKPYTGHSNVDGDNPLPDLALTKGLFTIDTGSCDGCEDCITVCPSDVFVMLDEDPNDQLDIRLDPESTGWITGTLSEKSEHKGWVKFRDERQFDAPAIVLIADVLPPPIFATQGVFPWVPTIEFSVNIRNLPKTTWLKCVFRTRFVSGGLLEEDGEIWDTTGQLIAISRQIAQYRNE